MTPLNFLNEKVSDNYLNPSDIARFCQDLIPQGVNVLL
jgi:hypothetical protein